MIQETFVLTATNSDLLSGGRLNAIPYNGELILDFQADLSNATNNFAITIQKPDGDVPVSAQQVMGGNPALGGVLDERHLTRYRFKATQGGHFTVVCTETGAAILSVRATLR